MNLSFHMYSIKLLYEEILGINIPKRQVLREETGRQDTEGNQPIQRAEETLEVPVCIFIDINDIDALRNATSRNNALTASFACDVQPSRRLLE